MKLKQGKAGHLDKFICTQLKNNTVFELLVLGYGIAMKNSLEIAKVNKFVQQNRNMFY